ncbi:MAG: DUF6768 family protein [Acidobacteriota bacterium]
MIRTSDVDALIREAVAAEDAEDLGLPDDRAWLSELTGVFRSHLRWFGAMFMIMLVVFFGLAVYCGWRFLTAPDDAALIRWGCGFLFCTVLCLSGKIWYWMEAGRLATIREIKRVELLVAHLTAEIRKPTEG